MTRSSNVIRFRVRRRRRRRAVMAGPAQVYVLPPLRHSRILDFITTEMQKKATVDAADLYLASHLDIEWQRQADLGIPASEIEYHCRQFARAAWRIAISAFRCGNEGDVA